MQEYEYRGHINQNNEDTNSTEELYYLPRPAVCKSSNSTSQGRVVLDVSCRSGNELGLNDMLVAGPTLQEYLYCTVLRFRT